jgi:hypothetical protein
MWNNPVARKGRLDEIFSKALYAGDSALYTVGYRDFENIVEVSLPEFVKLSENFQAIPQSRIITVKKGDNILYHKHGY